MRLVLALALTVSGCSLPQPRVVGNERSSLEPIERLGRWNGDHFVAVEAGSVPPSHAYVLVHGWAPGWGEAVTEDPRVRAWEATDRLGEVFEPWMTELARRITDTDPHAVVLVYSWLDDAATNRFVLAQRYAWARTEVHGGSLAAAVDAMTREDFERSFGRVHLIGHSYGARVATFAALNMAKTPAQLTLLDVPDAPMTRMMGGQSNLSEILQLLPIGNEPGDVFVDNYVSMYGERYGDDVPGIVDVHLTPPFSAFAVRQRHLYGTWFYAESALHEFGLGWSPLIGQPPSPGCYEQPWGEIELRAGCTDLR